MQVQLLGTFAVERDGGAVVLPVTPARLLAFLALHPGPHDRDAVAARFWPEATTSAARANLRTAVWALRQALGPDALSASRSRVGLAPDGVRVDLAELRDTAADDPAGAAAGCSGELLPSFGDDWAAEERAEHRRWQVAVLDRAAAAAESAGREEDAARWSRTRCRLTPFEEPAHAALVRRLAAAGDRAGALAAGREFATRLREEFGVAPGPALRAALAELRGPGRSAPATAARRAPLFGRSAELSALTAAWSRARDGRGGVVVLTGEAGIGKTRLTAELADRVSGAGGRVAGGAAVDVGEPAPLGLWAEIALALARQVPAPPPSAGWPPELGRLASDLAVLLGRGPGLPPPVASPELERLRVFDAVLRLVEWAAGGAPVLLIAEDLHGADRASLALCAHVARRVATLPVLLLLTRRDRPARSDADALVADVARRGVPVAELVLDALAPEEIAAVVRSVAPLGQDDVDRVVASAEGSPLLAVERARLLAGGDRGLPLTLRAAVRAAAGPVPRPARDLLELLAVAGRALSPAEVDALAVAGPDDLAAAEDTGLLSAGDDGLRYRHALLAEAARCDLVREPGRRSVQLAVAVEAAAGDARARVAAEVAGHLQRAGRDDLAGPRWRDAARHARELGTLDEAADFWAEAAHCAPEDPDPRLELAEVQAWRGRREDYEHEWEAAIALVPPAGRAAAWCRRGAVMRSVLCHPSAGLAAYTRALELLGPGNAPALRAEALAGLAQLTAAAGDPDLVPGLLRAAGGDATLDIDRHSARLLWLIRTGRYAEVEAQAELGAAALEGAARPDQAYAGLLTAACALAAAGDLAAALRVADHAVALTRDVPVLAVPCLAGRAHLLSRTGRPAEALACARAQLALAERLDSDEVLGLARYDAGLVALATGAWTEAAELLDAALAGQARFSRPASRLARAEALARDGRPGEAAAEIRAAALEPIGPGDQPWALVPRMARAQGLVALAAGDLREARRRLAESVAAWRRLGRPEPGRELMASLVDLGRLPVVGLVDPAWELARVEAELAAVPEEEPCPPSH
nr:AAA family ATPase [Petropleomorpha daqingensis]